MVNELVGVENLDELEIIGEKISNMGPEALAMDIIASDAGIYEKYLMSDVALKELTAINRLENKLQEVVSQYSSGEISMGCKIVRILQLAAVFVPACKDIVDKVLKDTIV